MSLQYLFSNVTKAYNSLVALKKEDVEKLMIFPNRTCSAEDASKIRGRIAALEKSSATLQKRVEVVAEAIDRIEDDQDPDLKKFDEKLELVTKLIDETDVIITKYIEILAVSESTGTQQVNQEVPIPAQRRRSSILETEGYALPPVKIPSFSGKRWDFDQFWKTFEEIIGKSKLPNIIKFTNLLNLVDGEAKQLLEQFQITPENYEDAVALLKEKYSDARTTIMELNEKIRNDQAKDGSITEQRALYERLKSFIKQLQRHGEQVENTLMEILLIEKFNLKLRTKVYERKIENPENWKLEDVFNTLEKHIKSEEQLATYMKKMPTQKTDNFQKSRNFPDTVPKAGQFSKSKPSFQKGCVYCNNESHVAFQCPVISSSKARKEFLQRNQLCLNCATKGHMAKECKSRRSCQYCNSKHHSSICHLKDDSSTPTPAHAPSSPTPQGKQIQKWKDKKPKSGATNVNHTEGEEEGAAVNYETETSFKATSKAFLPTIQTKARNAATGEWENVSILLDTGADRSFIKQTTAKALQLTRTEGPVLRMRSFGSSNAEEPETYFKSTVSLQSEDKDIHLEVLQKEHMTGKIQKANLTKSDLMAVIQKKLNLNMDNFQHAVEPDILIGQDHLSKVWKGETISLPSGIMLINTTFGYTSMGTMSNNLVASAKRSICKFSMEDQPITVVHSILEEEPVIEFNQQQDTIMKSPEEFTGSLVLEKKLLDEATLQSFEETIEKRPEGYFVRLPLKLDKIDEVPDNFKLTAKRLQGVVNSTSPEVKMMIDVIFKDQLQKKILEKVTSRARFGKRTHYSPIHPVLTPHKATTKCRVVIDGSAHYKGTPSLNDAIEQGPVILPDILDILLRFRSGETVILADCEKAFLQVWLNEKDRDLTRTLWLKDINLPATPDNIEVYRSTRVLFGLNASPFLLGATITHHLKNYVDKDLARRILPNFYVDNLVLTFDESLKDAIKLYKILKSMFQDMKMNLREFLGNLKKFNENLPESDRADAANYKVLGIQYDPEADTIKIECKTTNEKWHSRRSVSSRIASDFDPKGLLTPIQLPSKLFQRELWKEEHNYDWDTPLSQEHNTEYIEILDQLEGFSKTLPRKVVDKTGDNFLICFCDASKDATACCIYAQNKYGMNILLGKSKVKPLKETWTIPKLEMHAIRMGTEKTLSVLTALQEGDVKVSKVFILSDSEIALSWLKTDPGTKEVGKLVANRVQSTRNAAEMMSKSGISVRFGHVKTDENPADLGTRGISKVDFQESFWWTGPDFCRYDKGIWETYKTFHVSRSEEEVARVNLCHVIESNSKISVFQPIFTRTNSLLKVRRSISCVMRAIWKMSKRLPDEVKERMKTNIPELQFVVEGNIPVSANEQHAAERRIIREHQAEMDLKNKNYLNNLNLQLDEDGIIICRGRFEHIELGNMAKNPIIIEPKSVLAEMIIREAHGKYHCNVQQTMAEVRTKFWIPRLRQQVNSMISKCVRCQRYNKHPFRYPNMTDLPKHRVRESKPFEITGVDYFGPIPYRMNLKDEQKEQGWGCLFTCATTRLTHIQFVLRLDTESFINAIQRFIATCGRPKRMVSDNAPQFILADKILKEIAAHAMLNEDVLKFLGRLKIEWSFITPYAPWQGGLYERLMRSTKQALYKSIGQSILTFDILTTVFAEVAAMLNSRPLVYIGESFGSGNVLRPTDFVYPKIQVTFPFETTMEMKEDYIIPEETTQTREGVIQAIESGEKIVEKAWKIWHSTYLAELRSTHKLRMDSKKSNTETPFEGQVVLVCDQNVPRHHWRLAEVVKIQPSADGIIREIHLKTDTQIIKRPLNLVVPLEIEGKEPETKEVPVTNPNDLEEQPISQGRPYNLRNRPRVDYQEPDSETYSLNSFFTAIPWSTVMIMTILSILIGSTSATAPIECTATGIRVLTEYSSFEVCVKDFCASRPRMAWNSNLQADVWIPQAIKIAPHHAIVKILLANAVTVYEVECPGVSTCENIDCVICFTNIINPECHPYMAIAGLGIFLYLFLMICYCIFRVKVPCGAPFIMAWKCLVQGFLICLRCCQNRLQLPIAQRRRFEFQEMITLVCIILMAMRIETCQEVDLLSQGERICSTEKPEKCKMVTQEHLTINSYSKQACVRLDQNGTTTKEIRIEFKEIQLECLKASVTFTKANTIKVWSAKRCAHTGSCVDEKCLNVSANSLIPELGDANNHIGNTYCSESCGGLGCGCFFPSPGCLFYRIYADAKKNESMEIFQCTEWKEVVMIGVAVTKLNGNNRQRSANLSLPTNLPQTFEDVTIKSAWTNKPVSTSFNNWFIRNEKLEMATWKPYSLPALQCEGNQDNDQCHLTERCNCLPAEDTMRCSCEDTDPNLPFNQIQTRLPIREGHWTLRQKNASVTATISDEVTVGLVLTIQDKVSTSITTSTDKCYVKASELTGCYNCATGAQSEITCFSSKSDVIGNIICDQNMFTVPCSRQGSRKNISFFEESAKFRRTCTINCGGQYSEYFKIVGTLKFTGSIWTSIYRILEGKTTISAEIAWPDWRHLWDSYMEFMKSFMTTIIIVLIVVATTGTLMATIFLMGLRRTIKWTIIIVASPFLFCRMIYFFVTSRCQHSRQETDKQRV